MKKYESQFYVSVDPDATLQYRYYYNSKRREEHGKHTELNSMNYLTGVFKTYFADAAIFECYMKEEKTALQIHSGWAGDSREIMKNALVLILLKVFHTNLQNQPRFLQPLKN